MKFYDLVVGLAGLWEVRCIEMFFFEEELIAMDIGVHDKLSRTSSGSPVVLFEFIAPIFVASLRVHYALVEMLHSHFFGHDA